METNVAKWLVKEDTSDGPSIVDAFTDAEMDSMLETSNFDGVVVALANMPEKAIITETALARVLAVTTRTIRRMVQRNEIPPAVNLAGKSVWFAGNVLSHLQSRAERVAKDAERRHAARLRLIA